MESHVFIRLNIHQLHGGFQAGTVLQLMLLAEELLDVAQGRQRNIFAVEEMNVLIQDADVVNSPGEQGIVLTAPGGELLQRFPERRRSGQGFRIQAGHPADAGMDPEIVGRRDRDGNGVSGVQVGVQFHGADLDHLENQLVTDLTVGAALIGDGLVPFKVKDDVGHMVSQPQIKNEECKN